MATSSLPAPLSVQPLLVPAKANQNVAKQAPKNAPKAPKLETLNAPAPKVAPVKGKVKLPPTNPLAFLKKGAEVTALQDAKKMIAACINMERERMAIVTEIASLRNTKKFDAQCFAIEIGEIRKVLHGYQSQIDWCTDVISKIHVASEFYQFAATEIWPVNPARKERDLTELAEQVDIYLFTTCPDAIEGKEKALGEIEAAEAAFAVKTREIDSKINGLMLKGATHLNNIQSNLKKAEETLIAANFVVGKDGLDVQAMFSKGV